MQVEINGLVHVGKQIHDHLIIAENGTVEDIAAKYLQECRLMSELRHPNITIFMGLCFVPKHQLPLIITEKLDGSLDDLLETIPSIPLVLKHSILKDAARGLLYLHEHHPPIIHANLTARNVLLTKTLEAKISDVGDRNLVNVQPDFPGVSTTFFAPEVVSQGSLGFCSSMTTDVFSFGHLTLFTLTQVSRAELEASPFDSRLV